MHRLFQTSLIVFFSLVAVLGVSSALAENSESSDVSAEIRHVVNINAASAEEIAAALKGVGVKKASDIVAYREAHGPFKTKESLTGVKGFGEKTLQKNWDVIALE